MDEGAQRGPAKHKGNWGESAMARDVLMGPFVMYAAPSGRRGWKAPTVAAPSAPPSSAQTLDAMIESIIGGAVGLAPEALQSRPSAVSEPVRRLMLDLLRTAIADVAKGRGEVRADALAWLRDTNAPIDVRTCCDALGIAYEPMMRRLEVMFTRVNGVRVPRKYGAGFGMAGRKAGA